jgi:uncharacterized protein YdiU (UPF0061 family)
MMGRKIGFTENDESIKILIHSLLDIMKSEKGDYTNVFSHLMDVPVPNDSIYHSEKFIQWKANWEQLINERSFLKQDLFQIMQKENPIYIPRNYLVEEALEKFTQEKDEILFNSILTLMQDPYTFREENKTFQQPPVTGDAYYKTFCNT